MLAIQKYKNKEIAIYGMGITGRSAAKTFKKMGAKVFCWDDNKKVRRKIKNSNYIIEKFWLKKKIDKILISPGIDIQKCRIKKYIKKNLKKIVTDLDLFFEFNKRALIISVTGTNGKSTTCKIIEKILKAAKYNVKTVGNIGNPILYSINSKKKYTYIIEVSSYQLQYSKLFRSKHAAILNITPDHLERHKSITNYVKTKSKIFFAQNSLDYLYINSRNKYSKLIKKIFRKKKIKSKLISIDKNKFTFLLKKINNKYFNSKGNFENLVFSYKIARKLHIKNKTIIKALNNFKGLSHRQEIVFSNRKIICVNDSKATSFDASVQSLANYNKIYWIVGGLPKYKDIFYLKNIKNRIIKAYIIGTKTNFFKQKIKNSVKYQISKNIKNAIANISNDLKSTNNLKKTILLSPAAASFDQFKNFESRGLYFKNLVRKHKRRLSV